MKYPSTLLAALYLGAVAFFFARALHIPVWRYKPTLDGDATDIGVFTAIGVFCALNALKRAIREAAQ